MILTKKGIETKEWIPPEFDADTIIIEGYYESTFHTPKIAYEFFKFWHDRLESITDDYTLGDLIDLLTSLDEVTVTILSVMCDLDLAAFLLEARLPSKDTSSDIEFLEVTNIIALSTYQKDPDHPDERMEWLDDYEAEEEASKVTAIADITGEKPPIAIFDATGDDFITGKPVSRRMRIGEMYGKWVGPYNFNRDFHGWGHWDEPYPGAIDKEGWDPNFKGGISLSFTPVNELLRFPLRYNDRFEMRDDLYKGNVLVSDGIDITFGEFVHAVLWELGFYGSPSQRDEKGESVLERANKVREKDTE